MSIFDEGRDTYVRVTIDGPFGEMQQVSARMKPAESAMTAASLERSVKTGFSRHITKVEVINLRHRV